MVKNSGLGVGDYTTGGESVRCSGTVGLRIASIKRRALLGIEPRPLAIESTQSKYRTSRLQGLAQKRSMRLISHGDRYALALSPCDTGHG